MTEPNVPVNAIGGGFFPQLYTVANGTYTSDNVYGSMAPSLNNYNAYQLTAGTTTIPLGTTFFNSSQACSYDIKGNKVCFVCEVVLDGAIDPGYGTQELRIRAFPPYNPQILSKSLPRASNKLVLPLFEDVEILNKDGVPIAPSVGVGTLLIQARLLLNGEIALVLKNIGVVPSTSRGLQNDDIAGGYVVDNVIRIIVRGTYLTDAYSGANTVAP